MPFPLQTPFLYAVVREGLAANPAGRERIRAWLRAGAGAVQLREKSADAAAFMEAGAFLRTVTREYGALLIVNDDPRLAEALDADGCHLGQEDMPVEAARRILKPGRILGLSTHNREQVLFAREMDLDYIGAGPVFPTGSKKDASPVTGPAFAAWAEEASGLPAIAIGGVTAERAALLAAEGCRRVAVIGALHDCADPEAAARELLTGLAGPRNPVPESLSPRDRA